MGSFLQRAKLLFSFFFPGFNSIPHLSSLGKPPSYLVNQMFRSYFLSLNLLMTAVIAGAFTSLPPKGVVHTTSLLRASNSEDLSGILRSGPYVPSGLTAEEYQQLKQKEAEKLRKMDFGAWGPRFKKSDRPNGDWLLQPKLWSMGFSAVTESDLSITSSTESPIKTQWKRIRTMAAHNIQPCALFFVWLHVLVSVFRVTRSVTSFRTTMSSIFTFHRIQSIGLVGISMSLSPLIGRWLEWFSRRRLWTTRRTTVVSIILSLLVYVLCTAMVTGIRLLIS